LYAPRFFVLLPQRFIYGRFSGFGIVKGYMYNKKAAAKSAAAFVFFNLA
jgi:hypothetical protein